MNRREFIQTTSLAAAATFVSPSFSIGKKPNGQLRSRLFGIAAAYPMLAQLFLS
jgi:hypothetical protein